MDVIMVDTGRKCLVCGKPVKIAKNIVKFMKWEEEYCSRDCADKGILKQGETKPVD